MRRTVAILLVGSLGCSNGASEPPPQQSGAQILREFQAGTRTLPAGDGVSFLRGKAPGPCAALPSARPADFQINYFILDGRAPDRIPPRFAISERSCEVIWRSLHMGKPEVHCTRLASQPSQQLYRELRALAPHTIKTRPIDASPHRGGYTVAWHWSGHACSVSDSGPVQVDPADDVRFRELVGWVTGACRSAGTVGCP